MDDQATKRTLHSLRKARLQQPRSVTVPAADRCGSPSPLLRDKDDPDRTDYPASRERVALTRLKQDEYRADVLAPSNNACAVTGCSVAHSIANKKCIHLNEGSPQGGHFRAVSDTV